MRTPEGLNQGRGCGKAGSHVRVVVTGMTRFNDSLDVWVESVSEVPTLGQTQVLSARDRKAKV